jgi:hypothetical protein
MSTYIHPLQSTRSRRFEIVQRSGIAEAKASTNTRSVPADDGLGCMRGLLAATLFNILLFLTIVAVWGLWRFLH